MTSHAPSWPTDDSSVPHPGVELLADLAEDLVDPADLPALRRHLSDCEDCADTYAALAEVRDLLGSTPTPPMPADVAARIDAALASAAAPVEAAPVETARPTAQALAAPPNRKTETTGPGRTGRRHRRILVGTAALVATLGLGMLVVQQDSPPRQASSASAPTVQGQHPALASGVPVYSEDQLTEQIHRLIAGPGTPKSFTGRSEAAGTVPSADPADAALPDCLPAATGHGAEHPLAVGPGRFGQAEVTALVYPIAGRPGQLDVYLVTPVCPGATVLLHRTVPTG